MASGERVLSLLAEEPELKDVESGRFKDVSRIDVENLNFAYGEEQIFIGCQLISEKRGNLRAFTEEAEAVKYFVKTTYAFLRS